MTDSPVPAGSRAGPPAVPAPGDAPAHPVEAGSLQTGSVLFGRPAAYHASERVDQALAQSDFARLTSLVANLDPDAGRAREFGGGLLWEHDSGYSALSLTIAPEGTGAVIRADTNLGGRQFAYFGAAVAGAGLVALVVGNQLPGLQAVAVGLGSLLPLTVAARSLWNASARRSAVALRRLVDQVAAAMRGELS